MITKDRLIEIFQVKTSGTYYSDIGVYGGIPPTDISYFKLKRLLITDVSDIKDLFISKRIIRLAVPTHLTYANISIFDRWLLGKNKKDLKAISAVASCNYMNPDPIWVNCAFSDIKVIEIFENYKDCLNYCKKVNEKSQLYGHSTIESLIELLHQGNDCYEDFIHLIKSIYGSL